MFNGSLGAAARAGTSSLGLSRLARLPIHVLYSYIQIYVYIKSIHVQMPTHKCITTNAGMEPAITIMNIAVNINSDIHNFGARIITVHLVIIHTHTARIATWRMYAGPRKRPACIESICPAPMLLETQLGDCALGSPGLSPRRAA